MARLSRVEQTLRNRELVLEAGRQMFMARGYHGATLEKIADAAGFSRGVVYSQFRTKADLFLVLLEERIAVRGKRNIASVREAAANGGMAAFLEQAVRVARNEPEWGIVLIEFRLHAARDPELNRRYVVLHTKTIHGLAEVFAEAYNRAGEPMPLDPVSFAEAVFALGTGVEVEQANNPDAVGGSGAGVMVSRLFAPVAAGTPTD